MSRWFHKAWQLGCVGALVSQLAPNRRLALELGGAVVGVGFVLRVIADTSTSLDWLRWLTPLGWAEELRPFTGGRPAVCCSRSQRQRRCS